MQHSDFSLDELQDSPFPIPRKKKKKKLYTGTIRFFPTLCTIGPIHYLLHKSHLQKTKLIRQNLLPLLVFHDCYRLFRKTVISLETKRDVGTPSRPVHHLSNKSFFFFFFKVGKGEDRWEKKRGGGIYPVFIFLLSQLQLIYTYDFCRHRGKWLFQHIWPKPLSKTRRGASAMSLQAICPVRALVLWVRARDILMYCKEITKDTNN